METFVGVLGMVLTAWLGLLFVSSASLKLARYGESARLLRPYRILPASLASLVGLGLPWMELLTGGLLFFALLPPVGALSGGMLAIGFAFSGAAVLFRGMDVPCGCASAGEKERVTPATLVRALTILGSCVFLLVSGAATTQIPTLAAGALAVVALLPGGLSAKRRITQAHLKRLAERRDREERSRLERLLGGMPENAARS